MAKKGWADASIHEEWGLWCDEVAAKKLIPNVDSRPKVIEYALQRLKKELKDPGPVAVPVPVDAETLKDWEEFQQQRRRRSK